MPLDPGPIGVIGGQCLTEQTERLVEERLGLGILPLMGRHPAQNIVATGDTRRRMARLQDLPGADRH